MIVAEQKPVDELIKYIEGCKNVLIAACGTCVTVCMAGGEKEARELAALLEAKSLSDMGEADINELNKDSGDLKTEANGLNKDNSDIETNVNQMNKDHNGLKTETNGLNKDSGNIKNTGVTENAERWKNSGGKRRKLTVRVVVPKRQCDMEFLDDIAGSADGVDVILSMGCGAGVQYMAERFSKIPVLPAVNTRFIGVARDIGVWTEMCQGCGECILERTGGVCPVSRCSKSNFNGPCGGSSNGKCEIAPDVDCGWQLIYNRLKELGRLDRLYEIIEPKDWRTSRDGGPRKVEKKEVQL